MCQRRETVELGTIKARMGRGIRPSAAQNVAAFGAGLSVLGLMRIGRNAFSARGDYASHRHARSACRSVSRNFRGNHGRVAPDRRLARTRASGSLKSNMKRDSSIVRSFLLRCMSPLLAQSGHSTTEFQCPLGVKRTLLQLTSMSTFDPKRTSSGPGHCTVEWQRNG
jgi:hypothetical protein